MTLSKTERLILANQFTLLSRTSKGVEAAEYRQDAEIAERGYAVLYDKLFRSIDDEMPVEASEYVLDVLSMYRAIHNANLRLPKKESFPAKQIAFPGFDHNNEGSETAFANFFTCDMRRFPELIGADKRIRNTHAPTDHRYAAMLDAWRACADKNELTRDDVGRVLAAGDNPRPRR